MNAEHVKAAIETVEELGLNASLAGAVLIADSVRELAAAVRAMPDQEASPSSPSGISPTEILSDMIMKKGIDRSGTPGIVEMTVDEFNTLRDRIRAELFDELLGKKEASASLRSAIDSSPLFKSPRP